jgi:hypothetical protein
MKKLILCIIWGFFVSILAEASWFYNFDAGIGIYKPEGWPGKHNGRSTQLTGPTKDFDQSQFFLGSDWVNKINNTDELAAHMRQETTFQNLSPITISGLSGFAAGTSQDGAIYLMRIKENVIVIRYQIRGSIAQMQEAQTMLESIEIRTKPYEN